MRRAQRAAPACSACSRRPASVIPRTGAVLKASAIRGVESNGMLCSGYELGSREDHEGIIELPAGLDGRRQLSPPRSGLDDPVLDIKITANRADCLGVRGIARDLAASGLGALKPLDIDAGAGQIPVADRGASRRARRQGLPAVPRPAGARRQERPEPALAAGSPRPRSACGRSRRWSTSPISSPSISCRPLHVFDAGKLDGDLALRGARPAKSWRRSTARNYALDGEHDGDRRQ